MWSGLGSASSLNCPAFFILEFQSTGMNLPILYPGWLFYFLPQEGMSLLSLDQGQINPERKEIQ